MEFHILDQSIRCTTIAKAASGHLIVAQRTSVCRMGQAQPDFSVLFGSS